MDEKRSPEQRQLDYATPARRDRGEWLGVRRVGLGLGLTVAHYVIGLAAVLAFNNTRAIGAILLTFLFPLGIVASYINPHRMALAAIANSVFCGFVAAYGLSIWLNRKV